MIVREDEDEVRMRDQVLDGFGESKNRSWEKRNVAIKERVGLFI